MLDFFLNKIFHPYYIYPVHYSAWGIRLNALVNVQLVMSAKHLVSTRCQQCARWPHLCPSSWLSRYMLTGKLKFQTSHNICSGNSYSSMLPSITFTTCQIQYVLDMSVLFSKCLELGKIMEGYQANPHFKKMTFSYSVHENPEVINIMNAFTMQMN